MDFRFNGSEIPGIIPTTETKDVKAGGAATIAIGDMVREDDGNPGYVKKGADGDTDTLTKNRVYLAIGASDETAGADGTVKVMWCPYMRLLGTVDDVADLVQAIVDTRVTLEVDTGVQKIDADDTTNGFMRIKRPEGGIANWDTTNGYNVEVIVNEKVT